MIAGYTGTQQRATYTCVGDTVNLASRLENVNKIYGDFQAVKDGYISVIAVSDAHWGRLFEAMSDWTPQERSDFGHLLERFNHAVDRLSTQES